MKIALNDMFPSNPLNGGISNFIIPFSVRTLAVTVNILVALSKLVFQSVTLKTPETFWIVVLNIALAMASLNGRS
jgi:hypothetical protein